MRFRLVRGVSRAFEAASWFHVAVFLFYGARIHPSYGLTWRRRLGLARRMRRNTRKVQTGLSYRGHLAIAVKVLEQPPSVEGVIVEAGCWKGGTTVNLSLIARASGRKLVVYDSFEGLPPPVEGDHWASAMGEGAFKGELEEVRSNVTRFGAIEVCEFRKGWFSDTMGDHAEPIVLAYVDVDYQSSFHDCILGLWPHLVPRGYMFIDEYTRLDYCALFFSERYWRTYFDRPPPGLMGAGSGVGIGQVFPGPLREFRGLQRPASVAWTRKDFYAEWDFEAGDVPETPLPGGGIGDRASREGWTLTTESMQDHEAKILKKLIKGNKEAREAMSLAIAEQLEADEGARQAFADGLGELLEKDEVAKKAFEGAIAEFVKSSEDGGTMLIDALIVGAEQGLAEGRELDPQVVSMIRQSAADNPENTRLEKLLSMLDAGALDPGDELSRKS